MFRKDLFYILSLCLLFLSLNAYSQVSHTFTSGLLVGSCHQYGREGLFTDQFAYRYFSGNFQKPFAGQVLYTNDKNQAISWKPIQADSAGRFTSRDAASGYLYLTYNSTREQSALINISGHSMVYFNGEPHAGDIYGSNWLYIPVKLKKGENEFYIRTSRYMFSGITAKLVFLEKEIIINTEDPTLPHVVLGQNNEPQWGGVVVINASNKPITGATFQTILNGKKIEVPIPAIAPLSSRKVPFKLDGSGITQKGTYNCDVILVYKGKILDSKTVSIEAATPQDHYSNTFLSNIDGSVQYYGVSPQSKTSDSPSALFLSVHGAGVEAIGQARAYKQKDWGNLVAPTNRRPRGFNWEDWGRIDALEVLDIAVKKFNPDPQRIYLTGHSMGGHGTWYLGATYPGKWAAIAPCAGYPSLMAYGSADGKIPQPSENELEKNLFRASNGSNVLQLLKNYNASGIYIHHGDSDKVVSVDYARQMRAELSNFHKDFSYFEYPGGSHWFGDQSVDWAPLFDFFKWHTIPHDSTRNVIEFSTANTAISASYYWATILQQSESLKYSRYKLTRNIEKNTIIGTTENVSILAIDVASFKTNSNISLSIDGQSFEIEKGEGSSKIYLHKNDKWAIGKVPDEFQKGIVRNGTFKEPFNNRMVFVYGTSGTTEENNWAFNKARFDAETWYYRGNGAVDMISDKEFNPASYPDQGIIIYGNATTNSAYNKLLTNCPILVKRGSISFGKEILKGNDLGAYFMWPRNDSKIASVAVITGTGIQGMHAADANQYFSGGSGFPDYMIFSTDLVKEGIKGLKFAGFFNNSWELSDSEKR